MWDPGIIWEGYRYCMGGIQVLHGMDPGTEAIISI